MNALEGICLKMIRTSISVKLKIKNAIISIKESKELQLREVVVYYGKRCLIINATAREGEYPYDRLYDLGEIGTARTYLAKRSEFKRELSFHNLKIALTAHYKWWKMYHYKHEVESKLRDHQLKGEWL